MTAVPAPRPSAALDFLAGLYDGTDTGWVHLFALDHDTGQRTTRWATVHNLDALADEADALAPTCSVWYGVAPRDRDLGTRRGGSADCISIPALWADIDIAGPGHAATNLPPDRAAAWELIRAYPLRPTYVIDTGGGLQPYWQLDEPVPADQAVAFLARWGATWAELGRRHGWHVDNVFDLARVMRLPGTWNRKPDHTNPPLVEVCHEGTERYSLADLDEHTLDLHVPAPTPGQAAERRVPYIGPERPGDAFNAATDPGLLLERAGFHFDHQATNGDRHYRAPHRSDRRESTGATVYADGHTTIWSETFAAGHGLAVKRPYDPFGLYAGIWHRGDWTAATTELSALGFGAPSVSLSSLIAKIPPAPEPPAVADEGIEDDWTRLDLVEALVARRNGTAERIIPTILEVHTR
jgi:hypothetical protein